MTRKRLFSLCRKEKATNSKYPSNVIEISANLCLQIVVNLNTSAL